MKKSKIILGITIGILIIAVGLGITYYALTKKENKVITQIKQDLENKVTLEDKVYEYGSEITLQKLNLDSNVKVYINNQELNNTYKFTEVGEYRLKAETSQIYKNFLNKEEIIIAEKEATIKVVDTKKPIIEGVTDKEITEGDTNKSSKSTTGKSTNSKKNNTTNKVKNNSTTQNKSNITTNKDNSGSTSNSSTSSEEQATYQGTTDGQKYYFQDREEEGNYSEKFSW